ncbi:alpha/beta fold hydrolase [Streptomyces sp. PTY087I2]|uniref:alpha/beta fold hydrolase n=1 Tax=Streptomyces sp. PTY087I2 TaxID=1819298 RepID=UPI00080BD68F|nr:alpha/beta hydrolase [Streptomyces sp. PTY087I2]
MPTFRAPDGTLLAHRAIGAGGPMICLPGGPTGADYLGDLGGLAAYRRLILLDPRGTGRSARPERAGSYRCDRQVGDVEALRVHLGLDRIDLLAHSGGANLAMQYAACHPWRVGRLVLIGPGVRAVGVPIDGDMRRALALRREGEPWFPAAFAELEAIIDGGDGDWEAVAPFLWGRWDAEARRHHAAARPDNAEAVAGFAADGAFDPAATRTGLAGFEGSALLLAGEFDLNSPPRAVAACAELFRRGTFVEQPGAGHCPWIDDPGRFVAAVASFLV